MTYRQLAAAFSFAAFVPGTATAQRLAGEHAATVIPAAAPIDTIGHFRAAAIQFGEDVFVTGQPTERALRELRTKGVTTIVNLRTPTEMRRDVPFDEAALAQQLGMRYVYVPVRGDSLYPYTTEAEKKFAEAMKTATGKVLLHCTVGWRASHMWAAYLVTERGLGVDSALALAHVKIPSMDHPMPGGEPVEGFLGRRLTFLDRTR